MTNRALTATAIALAVVALQAATAQARTVVVSADPTCQDSIKERYATIQAAVNASAVGGTVLVCPGTYPEQVVLSMPLIIKGVANPAANRSTAVITIPPGGLVVNVSNGTDRAQLVMQGFNTGQAQFVNLVVDGTGGTCSDPTSAIKLYNVGDSTWTSSAGIVSGVTIRNQCGDGVNAENSYITMQNSVVHDVSGNGFRSVGGDVLVSNNSMHNVALWGASLTASSNSIVQNNTLSTQRGVTVDGGSALVQVSGNIIGPFTGPGVLISESVANVKSNKINGAYAGVWLYKATGSMVMSNTLNHMYAYGIVDEASQTGNTIQNNVLTEMPTGIVVYNSDGSGDVISPNTFNAVDTMTSNALW
jgi:parallel beta-helix repeat protein